jgi:hypothetical protein
MQHVIEYRTVGKSGTKPNVNESLNTFSASGPMARHINIQTPRQMSILQGQGDKSPGVARNKSHIIPKLHQINSRAD